MANNCLVTKLKGTVDNPNLPVYGEMVLNLTDLSKATQNFMVRTGNEPVTYEFIGATPNDGVYSGTIPANTTRELAYTGVGKFKLKSKYGLSSLELNSSVLFEPDAAYYVDCEIGTNGKNVWDHVEKEVKLKAFSTHYFCLPLIRDADYSKVTIGNTMNYSVCPYDSNTPNKYNLSANVLQAVVNKMRQVDANSLTIISMWETAVVLDLSTLADFTRLTHLVVHNIHYTGDPSECFKPLINLMSLNIQKGGDTTKWDATSLFNYWAANGKIGTINLYVKATATVGGSTVDIPFDTNVVFSNGSWSIQ